MTQINAESKYLFILGSQTRIFMEKAIFYLGQLPKNRLKMNKYLFSALICGIILIDLIFLDPF